MAEKEKLKPPKVSEVPLKVPGLEGFTTIEKEVQNLFIPDEPESEGLDGFKEIDPELQQVFKAQGIETAEDKDITDKITERFFGTDVNDPEALLRGGTIIAGALQGANIGSKVPPVGPLGPLTTGAAMVIGSGVGAAFGAIAPEAATEIGESLGLLPEGTRAKELLSPSELRTLVEGEVLLDAATGGGLLAARQAGRTTARLLTGVDKEGRKLAQKAADLGIHLMPVQVGNRRIAKGFVVVLGRFPLLGGRIKQFGQAADEAAKRYFSELSSRVGPVRGFSDISEDIFRDAKTFLKEFREDIGARYEAFFRRADDLNVQVIPKATIAKAEEILDRIAKQTPKTIDKKPSAGDVLEKVKTFLEEDILSLERKFTITFDPQPTGLISKEGLLETSTRPPVLPKVSKQSVRQMDGLVANVDQFIASFEPSQRKFAMKLLNELRQAIQYDAIEHLVGKNAALIKGEQQALDMEFSQTMSEIFETATAKKFGSVQRRGITGSTVDETTRTPVDQLAKIVVKLESPQSIDELAKLVKPETFKNIVSKVMDDAVEDAFKTVGDTRQFDLGKFVKRLGLNKPNGKVFKSVKKMLKKSNAPYSMEDLQSVVEVMRKIEGTDIPEISSFIARRATIGGLKSILSSFIPGLALGTVGASSVDGYGGSTLMAMIFFMGGSRLFAKIISDPKSTRFLKSVIRNDPASLKEIGGLPLGKQPTSEAGLFLRRKVLAQTVSLGMKKMLDDNEITFEHWSLMSNYFSEALKTLDKEYDNFFDNGDIIEKNDNVSFEDVFERDDEGNVVAKLPEQKKEFSMREALTKEPAFGGGVILK